MHSILKNSLNTGEIILHCIKDNDIQDTYKVINWFDYIAWIVFFLQVYIKTSSFLWEDIYWEVLGLGHCGSQTLYKLYTTWQTTKSCLFLVDQEQEKVHSVKKSLRFVLHIDVKISESQKIINWTKPDLKFSVFKWIFKSHTCTTKM